MKKQGGRKERWWRRDRGRGRDGWASIRLETVAWHAVSLILFDGDPGT